MLRSDTSLPPLIARSCPSPTSRLVIEASQTKRAAGTRIFGYAVTGVAPPTAETFGINGGKVANVLAGALLIQMAALDPADRSGYRLVN